MLPVLTILAFSLAVTAPSAMTARPAQPDEPRVTLTCVNSPLRTVIERLFAGTGETYAISPEVPDADVTLCLRDVGFKKALRCFMLVASERVPLLTYTEDGGPIVFTLRGGEPAEGPLVVGPAPLPEPVTFDFRSVPLRRSLDILLTGYGRNSSVAPGVPNVQVNLSLAGQTLDGALRAILRVAATQSPGITFSREEGVYIVKIRQPPPPPPEPPIEPEEAAGDVEYKWEKIPLWFADAAAMSRFLGGTVFGEPDRRLPAPLMSEPAGNLLGGLDIQALIGVHADNSLLVRGTEDDINQLKTILRLLDTRPRQLRVTLSAGSLRASARAVGGALVRLSDRAGASRLVATVVPRVGDDLGVDLRLEGTLTLGGRPRSFATDLRLGSGQAVQAFSLGRGRAATRVWVRAELLDAGDSPWPRPAGP